MGIFRSRTTSSRHGHYHVTLSCAEPNRPGAQTASAYSPDRGTASWGGRTRQGIAVGRLVFLGRRDWKPDSKPDSLRSRRSATPLARQRCRRCTRQTPHRYLAQVAFESLARTGCPPRCCQGRRRSGRPCGARALDGRRWEPWRLASIN